MILAGLRVIRALAWLRLRTLVNTLVRPGRRSTPDRLARAAEIASWIILGAILVVVTAGTAIGAFIGGRLLAGGPDRMVLVMVRVLLLAQMALLVLTPFLRSPGSFGSAARLRLLPLPHALLHAGALLATLGDPWIAALAPGLAVLPLGLAFEGQFVAAAIAAVAGALMLVVMVATASACELAVQLVVRNRRRGEIAMLLVMLSITFSGFLPLMLASRMHHDTTAEETTAEEPLVDATRQAWLDVLPPGQFALALQAAASRSATAAIGPCVALASTGLLLGACSSLLHRRMLDEPERFAPSRGRSLPALGADGILSRPVPSLALASVRIATRTVWGRLAVFSPPIVVALLAAVQHEITRMGAETFSLPAQGFRLFYAGGGIALLNLQSMLANQFAVDRAGLTLQLLAPLSDLQLVRAKALAGAAMLALSTAGCALAAGLLGQPSDITEWLSALLGLASAFLLFAPLAAVLSAMFPGRIDAAQPVASSRPHPAAGIVAALATMILLALPALAFTLGRWTIGSSFGLRLVATWTIAAAVAFVATMPLAARVVTLRRERLALAASSH